MTLSKTLSEGEAITGGRRAATEPRIRWYGSGFMTANAGEPRQVIANIHTDDDYARTQGLTAAIADGMMSANWISSMLIDTFGADYITRGYLRTKFIKPIYVDEAITARGEIKAARDNGDGTTTYELEVWCEDDEGEKRTVGEAKVAVDN
jgi:acyl dehydratase